MIFGATLPLVGEQRERVVMAWFPIPLDDRRIAWLTRVRVRETARARHYPGSGYTPTRPGERGHWEIDSVVLA